MDQDNTIPPQIGELPDYYLGRLIYYDDLGDDNCRWIIYDGVNTIRFPSRAAAERYCIEVSLKISDDSIQNLMRSYEYMRRSYLILDKAAQLSPANHRLLLESIALKVRLMADKLDSIIAQIIHFQPNR